MYEKYSPFSNDPLITYTKRELYDMYLDEGRDHHEAFALSQELHRHLKNMNQRERRMWLRSLRDRGLYSPPKKETKEVS